QLNVEGLRADITLYKAATALAALDGRQLVTEQDLRRVATMALPHRMRRQPFEQSGLDPQELEKLMNEYHPPDSEQRGGASVAPSRQDSSPISPPLAAHSADRKQEAFAPEHPARRDDLGDAAS